MSVLVTGGAGFVGTRLANALTAAGESVRVLDNFDPLAHVDPDRHGLVADIELQRGDLRDPFAIERALEGVDRVFHLGGVVGNGESMINIAKAIEVNSLGTARLLEAAIARRDRVRKIVVASSMVVYGDGAYECDLHGRVAAVRDVAQLRRRQWDPVCPDCAGVVRPVPVREQDALRPASVYGISKRDQEELCLVLGRAYGIDCVALRYLNIYGPGQALGNPYTGVAAIFAARALAGRPPLVFEDGGQLRDLVHVDDVVRATVAAMHSETACGHAINVATGRRVSVATLASTIAAALDSRVEPEVTGEFRAGDIRHCFADTSRARTLLGFEAEVELEQGLSDLARWVERQTVDERGDAALAELRTAGLVA